ncbi:hypothetical protein LTR62_007414 [Meristemomyces frigidus]|uniref:Uncharacterized protein n=1 Tax=Meristemomyces frigidus TaxID=1508187 RepID=A0AAN7TMF8_9PEZI|nr:hypothetical protein LTR62_007414 [Meristemomyces frigidus]
MSRSGFQRHKSLQGLTSLLSSLQRVLSTQPEVTEGLYWLSIWSADGSLENESFNDVLQRLIVPRILKDEGVTLLWKLRNASPSARGGNASNGQTPEHGGPCALVVRLRDVEMTWTSRALQRLAIGRREDDQPRVFGTEVRTYELIQRYEGQRGPKAKGTCIVAVLLEPAAGADQDIDSWYRREHLAMIAAAPVHIRTTRYRLRTGLVHGANDRGPSLLALHECVSAEVLLDYAIQHGAIVKETAWSKRIFEGAVTVERTIWDITGKYPQGDFKLDTL